MRKLLLTLVVSCLPASLFARGEKERDRLEEAGNVMKEVLDIPEGIPKELLEKAECAVVLPSVKKLALGIGGSYGRGVMVCRTGGNFTGGWGAPVMIALEQGSIGWQIGGQATDFILLLMSPRSARAVLASKVKLGADASAAAGPKGRTAEAATDASMRAEILTYSRSRGLFIGVSLSGSTLRPDGGANENFYGRKVNARQLIQQAGSSKLSAVLNAAAPVNKSDPKSLQDVKR